MITRDGIIEYMRQATYRPLEYNELLEVFEIYDHEEELKFRKIIGKLEKRGK